MRKEPYVGKHAGLRPEAHRRTRRRIPGLVKLLIAFVCIIAIVYIVLILFPSVGRQVEYR